MGAMTSEIASVATAVGVLIAVWQLWLAHKQSITTFEDTFAKEYRELAMKLPTKALLGEMLTDEELEEHLDEFYHYFDLCNHQVFLSDTRRISKSTWVFWKDGILSNLARPAFSRAWSEIAARAGKDFSELRNICPPKKL